jgi:D-alanyl-D-alanine carboxypeptidase
MLASNISFSREYKSSLILDMDSGIVLQSYNPEEKIYPASLTKLMTLYITFEALDQGILKLDQKLIISRSAANQPASKLGILAGDKISVKTCIEALTIKSANDCAMVLSENISGEERDFAEIMTRVANEIGMDDTIFKNSSGLNNNNQVTTAKDMALLAMAIKRHFPHYYHYFNQRSFKYKDRTIYTHNNILNMYKGADGFKTGYTAASGYNLIASAKNDKGQRILGILIGFNSASKRDKEMVNLLDYGFEKLNKTTNMTYTGWKNQKNKPQPTDISKPKPLNSFVEMPNKNKEDNGSKFRFYKSATAKTNNIQNKSPISNSKINRNDKVYEVKVTPTEYKYKVQIGAFSEQVRAENYFKETDFIISNKYNYKNMIEVGGDNNNPIYRSQIYSNNLSDAEKICESLKVNNKSCFVKTIN